MTPGGQRRYGESSADRGLAADPIYLTDLARCEPPSAVGRDAQLGRWHTVPYESEEFAGEMLAAGPETVAPEATYPLRLSGWHAISIGIHPTSQSEGDFHQALLKLSGDRAYTTLTWPPTGGHFGRTHLHEIYWKTADLTGQRIAFRQLAIRVSPGPEPGALRCGPVRIAYIKLIPLNEQEVATLLADRHDSATRRLFAYNDVRGWMQDYRPTTEEEVRRQLEPYRDTDFARVYWEAALGDVTQYPSDVGRNTGMTRVDDYARVYDRLKVESWESFDRQGIDPFRVAVDYAHVLGLEFHACYRAGGWGYPVGINRRYDHFYREHPELRCKDRNGQDVPRVSYAFPETQDLVVGILREVVAKYPVDGVCMEFNRRPPYLWYEHPLVEKFTELHGDDPRELPADEPRWLAYRATVLTEFMRRLRDEVEEAAQAGGRPKRPGITALVLGVPEENRRYGLDVQTWAREGLIDTLIPYSGAPLALPSAEDTWEGPEQIAPFVAAVQGTQCRLVMNVMPYQMSPEAYRRMAAMLYDAGAEDLFFWGSGAVNIHNPRVGRADFWPAWNALRRLGHREEIEAWMRAGEPTLDAPHIALRTLDGWNMRFVAPG